MKEFEPDVSFEGFSIIYLTEELKQMLFEFLWGDYSWQIYGTKNKTKPEEYLERWDFFFKRLVRITFSYQNFHKHIETQPIVKRIVFNKSMNEAIVDFSYSSAGGEAVFILEDNVWIMLESEIS